MTIFNKPVQLALAENCADKVHACKGVNQHPAQLQFVLQPVVLLISVIVLCCPQSMAHTLHTYVLLAVCSACIESVHGKQQQYYMHSDVFQGGFAHQLRSD
jgi:hypothetical protein